MNGEHVHEIYSYSWSKTTADVQLHQNGKISQTYQAWMKIVFFFY